LLCPFHCLMCSDCLWRLIWAFHLLMPACWLDKGLFHSLPSGTV
jgi:hypothetical protein